MKKITDFIVKERYLFLILFIILAGVCLFLSTKVNINEDIMKYLPATSETKIGKDIMDEEFIEQDSSVLNVMFKGLSKSEKKSTLKKLANIDNVSSVDYENTKEYNKGDYTLYVLNVDDYDHSKTATEVYNYVNDHFKTAGMSGSIYEENKPILQLWIVVMAIAFAMIILIILSDSYVEPWLYLISIGIAIFINKGTNIMFDSVSSITNSIVAILQLALSMDYSIMLSNRYKQEKEKHPNKIEAMKEALYQSFKAISSSSVTTIVGLIALVFMSFTIGKDLGFVLAKGVLLSLISIFFCLPALLLIFDNLILKSKKKTPKFNLNKLGNYIYKTRYIQSALIVCLFVAAYLLKGNVGILFTGSQQDTVGKVFPATNQIAIVYNNKYEDIISDYCKKLEKDKKIDQVLCYSNTINEKLAYDELNNKFSELGQDVTIDNDLIKLIYYNYYNQDENNKMTLDEFIAFIKSDIYSNDNFNNTLNKATKDNLDLLENFTSPNLIEKKRSTKEIAEILGMNEEDANNILIYYNSKNLNTEMTIKDFVNFMLTDVANDPTYSSSLDKTTISKLKQLQNFTDLSKINKKMNATELANILGIDKSLVEQLFIFYRTTISSNTQITLNEFANFALALSNQDTYKDMFDQDTIQSLTILKVLSDKDVINNSLDQTSMKNLLDSLGLKLDDNILSILYLYYTGFNSDTKLTLNEFASTALNKLDKSYINDDQVISQLTVLNNLTSKQALSKNDLYLTFGINEQTVGTNVLNVLDEEIKDQEMTPNEFVILLQSFLPELNGELNEEQINALSQSLNQAQKLINDSNAYSVEDMTSILDQDNTIVSIVFGLYDSIYQTTYMTPLELVDMILNNKDNELLKDKITAINELSLVKKVMNSTTKGIKYSSSNLSSLLGINNDTMSLLYSLYNSKYIKDNQEISLSNYVDFIIQDVMNNEAYSAKFASSQKEKLTTINTLMNNSLQKIKYTSNQAFNVLSILSNNLDKTLLDLVYMYYGSSREYNESWKMTIEGFVNYLNSDIILDSRFDDFISKQQRKTITNAKKTVTKSKQLLVSDKYSRIVLNTKYAAENKETYKFINSIQKEVGNKDDIYVVGNSAMAVEMNDTFNDELNKITLLTMIFIFVVVAITFKDLIIPFVLVLIIQTAVYITMSAISLTGGSVYFISLLIVQAILMGATIDYAIVYTSYYRESRLTMGVKDSVINAYNRSINTIISSSSILIIVTLVVANFASAIAAKICETISQGTFAAVILILFVLPGVLATTDKIICRKGYYKENKPKN